MGTLLGLAGRGFAYLASALGLALWLLGVTLLIYAALHDALGGDVGAVDFANLNLQDLTRIALVTGGAVLGLVVSVLLLRFTHRIIPFLVCLAFGTVAFIGGATWRNEQTASEPQIAASSPELAAAEAASETAVDAAPAPTESPATDKAVDAAPPPAATAAAPPPMPPPPQIEPGAAPPQIEPGAGPSSEMAEAQVDAPRAPVVRRTPPRSAARPSQPAAAAPSAPALGATAGAGAATRATTARESEAAVTPAAATDQELRDAQLKFNKPSEMQLGAEYVVGATIALPGTENLPETLGNVGPTVSRQTKITRKVRVTLTGNDFEITSLDAIDTVVVTRDSPGQWNWRVKPRRDGQNLKLRISVFGIDEVDGKELGVRQLRVYDETINVNVTPIGWVRQTSASFVENWQPVAGALGILGGIWAALGHFFAGLRRKKEKEA